MCDALEFLQRLELVRGAHCDERIAISEDGTAKRTDFGPLSFSSAAAVSADSVLASGGLPPLKEKRAHSMFIISHKPDAYGLGLSMEYLLHDDEFHLGLSI